MCWFVFFLEIPFYEPDNTKANPIYSLFLVAIPILYRDFEIKCFWTRQRLCKGFSILLYSF